MPAVSQLGLSDSAIGSLCSFQALVEKWTPRINLISKASIPAIWERHIEDSALLCFEPLSTVRHWVDLGAGGGFPGLVIAIILKDKASTARVTLVESDLRKATFLREAARQLCLSVDVRSERAEHLAPLGADVVSARALAPLVGLCGLAHRHLAPGGMCLFPKGETFAEEITLAQETWAFDLEVRHNPDHKGSALLVLRTLRRAE